LTPFIDVFHILFWAQKKILGIAYIFNAILPDIIYEKLFLSNALQTLFNNSKITITGSVSMLKDTKY